MDDLDPRLLVDLLRDHIIPDKSLGQHFLLDQDVISRSIEICQEQGFPCSYIPEPQTPTLYRS